MIGFMRSLFGLGDPADLSEPEPTVEPVGPDCAHENYESEWLPTVFAQSVRYINGHLVFEKGKYEARTCEDCDERFIVGDWPIADGHLAVPVAVEIAQGLDPENHLQGGVPEDGSGRVLLNERAEE